MVKWIFVIYNIETFPGIWYRVKITPTFYTVSRKNSGQYDYPIAIVIFTVHR